MDFARIIFRDLGRNFRRTTMTITSIAVSLFVFCALMSFAKVPDQMRANANSSVRLVCRNKAGLGHGLPQAYTSKILGLPHIPEWQIPPDALAAFSKSRPAALVAPKLMQRYGWQVGDEVRRWSERCRQLFSANRIWFR